MLVEAIAVGVCGTDTEIADGYYGWAPPGVSRLVLGHESLGRVVDAGHDGFMSERWRIEPEYAITVDSSLGLLAVLLEPTSVVAKAWEQIVAVGQRAFWEPRTVLVTGAGPIGQALACADRSWLARLVTRRERPEDFAKALRRTDEDIKAVVQFSEA